MYDASYRETVLLKSEFATNDFTYRRERERWNIESLIPLVVGNTSIPTLVTFNTPPSLFVGHQLLNSVCLFIESSFSSFLMLPFPFIAPRCTFMYYSKLLYPVCKSVIILLRYRRNFMPSWGPKMDILGTFVSTLFRFLPRSYICCGK